MRILAILLLAVCLMGTELQAAKTICAQSLGGEGGPEKFDRIAQQLGMSTLEAYLGYEKGHIRKPIGEFSDHDKTLVIRELERLATDKSLQQQHIKYVVALKTLLEGESLNIRLPQDLDWIAQSLGAILPQDLKRIEGKIEATLIVIEKLRTKTPVGEEREIIFLEDHRGYHRAPIIFKTNYPGDVKFLENISPSSYRTSDDFASFQTRLRSAGYTADLVQRLPEKSPAPQGYPVVIGGGISRSDRW